MQLSKLGNSNQMYLIDWSSKKCDHLYESRGVGSSLVLTPWVCLNTMPSRKDISGNLREEINVAHQSGQGHKDTYKQFAIIHSAIMQIIHNWETLKAVVNLPRVDILAS